MSTSTTAFQVQFLGQTFTIDRVAFSIGNYPIYWYGILIAVGFFGALIYARRRAPALGVDPAAMIDAVLVGLIGGLVGARLYYVIFQWPLYANDLGKILDLHTGGLAIPGGILGAALCGGLMCRRKKIPLFSMFDLAGVGFLFGQAVGRWGNFINQEAFGVNTALPWGMFSEGTARELAAAQPTLAAMGVTVDPNLPVHPCFLYESLWCLLGFVLLHFWSHHRRFAGEIALGYVTWYGLGRVCIESIRTDPLTVGNLRVTWLLSLLCFIGGGIALLVLRRRHRPVPAAEAAYQPVFAAPDETDDEIPSGDDKED